MNNIKQLKESQREAHPGFNGYLECMTRSLFTGLSAFVLTFSGTYFGQKLVAKRLPYTEKTFLLVSSAFDAVASYKITKDRTNACQAGWMAAEDKHTALKESKVESNQ